MQKETSFLPNYDYSAELNAQYLRKVLQLMVQHQIPATPINYAIWYEYVCEKNRELNEIVDRYIQEKTAFDAQTSFELYRKYICTITLESFERINGNIQKIIDQTSVSLQETHAKADEAQLSFQKNTSLLENNPSSEDLNITLHNIIQETRSLTEVTIAMQSKLDATNQELDKMRLELAQVRQIASTDSLTGLLNRMSFDEKLAELVDSNDPNACLALLDIDHFKKVNDTYGHVVGDNVIKYVAAVMKKHTQPHHHIARYGGEEMAIIMPKTAKGDGLDICEKIRSDLEKSLLKRKDTNEQIGKVTISIGLSTLRSNDTPDSLTIRTDKSLYKAKETGRNKIVSTPD